MAEQLFGPRWADAIDACAGDAELARAVSEETASLLEAKRRQHLIARAPEEVLWKQVEEPFLALARCEGADEVALATAFFYALTRQGAVHEETISLQLGEAATRWLIRVVPERIDCILDGSEASFDQPPFHPQDRFLFRAISHLPGPEAAEWLVKLVRSRDWHVADAFRAMATSDDPEWTPEDWSLRLNLIADTFPERPGFLLHFPAIRPPAGCAPAQVRLACTYAEDETDLLLRSIAENIEHYRSGVPANDVSLYWWEGAEEKADLLLWILELSGAGPERTKVVAAALDAGFIDAQQAETLGRDLTRPAWADGEVPWAVSDVVDAGHVQLPDGRLAGGDPWWSFEAIYWTVELEPGSYPVRVVIAEHPLQGRQCAAAELMVDAGAQATAWELVESSNRHSDGYMVEVGVGSFGAVEALKPGLDMESHGEFMTQAASYAEVDGGEVGSLVMFTVGPQHQDCLTWIGRSEDGRIVRLVTDLGLMGIDPTKAPLPWA